MDSDFFTTRGYSRQEKREISHAMEDYLEMIYRYMQKNDYIRVNQLAAALNVQPPSASKMAAKLRDRGMIVFEPYDVIRLTQCGKELGSYLLHRHDILHRFLCMVNHTENELELVEKIEHHFNPEMVKNIKIFLEHNDQWNFDK